MRRTLPPRSLVPQQPRCWSIVGDLLSGLSSPVWCKNTSKKQELVIDHDTAVELPVLQHYLCLNWNNWINEEDNNNHDFDEERKMRLLPVVESFGTRLPPRLCEQVARVQVAGDHLDVMGDHAEGDDEGGDNGENDMD